jgi:hypothetical protein
MNLFKKINNIFHIPPPKLDRALYLYVQCDKCGEKLRARVDVWNDLTADFGEGSDDAASYHCRKVLVGANKCYQPIEIELKFDKNHKLIDKQINGGRFIDEAAFSGQAS